nr:retrovirus-related Pol polyprotein from transposon TNT 1-94 [Tanacetum cinerariifolium]
KDFEAKYNKFKAKLAPFSSSASAPSSFSSKNKGLIAESYNWDEEEVSSDDKETKVKAPMALTDNERISIGKESARNGEWTKITIKSTLYNSSEAKDSTLPNHNTDKVHSNISQRNTTNPSSVVSDSQASALADESSVCSTLLLPLKNLDGAEPSFGPKTVNSILKS